MTTSASVYKWATIDRVVNTAITFGGNIALARLLSPSDFGLLAMVAIFTAIAYNISSCGMSDGLICKLEPTARDYSTVFTFNFAGGVVFALLFMLMARPVATWFDHPQLVGIMEVIAVCFLCQVSWFVQETRLRKELKIKTVAIVHISATASSVALGITLAATGYGYWGLVATRVLISAFQLIYYLIATRWLPRLAIYRDSFKELFGFGINLMLAYIMNQVSRNINSFVLGRTSSSQSGVFSQAQKMEEVPYQLIDNILNSSFFVLISNEADKARRHAMTMEMLRGQAMLAVTLGALLMLLAQPGFNFMFGAKWDEAIPVFRVLIIFGVATTMKLYFQTILKAHGMTKLIRNLTLIEGCIQLGILAAIFKLGIIWIAWSQVAATVLILFFYARYFCHAEEVSFLNMTATALSHLGVPMAAFAVTAAGYWIWNGFIAPIWSCFLIIGCFGGIAILLWELFPDPLYIQYRNKLLKLLKRG